ncbi:MAG: copper chaperone PCu(A)C [Limnochordales bacterium]
MRRRMAGSGGLVPALWLLVVAVVLAAAPAAWAQGHVVVEGAWARAASVGANSAAYMRIVNHGPDDLVIVGAAADVAERVEIHQTIMEMSMVEGRLTQVMRMERIPELVVPAGSAVELVPGGLHVMLLTLTRELQEGDTFELALLTEDGGRIVVHVPVSVLGPAGAGEDAHHGH